MVKAPRRSAKPRLWGGIGRHHGRRITQLYGATVTAYMQTSLDQGQTWIDVAAVQFGTSGGVQVVSLSALDKLTTWTTPTDGALTPGTVLDGILGDQLRLKVISTGTYSGNTLLSVRGVAR
jgi:hypothetical protein